MVEKNVIDADIEFCEHEHTHEEVLKSVSSVMPSDDIIYEVAELFKVFGDSTRTKILTALFESEMCVCDICKILNMTKSAISHQLRNLRQSKLVKARKSGKEVFYSLADNHVKIIFKMAIDHVTGKDCD